MANQSFYGSIDFTKMLEAAKAGHPAFVRSEKNGHIYCSVTPWLNSEPDKYGNSMSLAINPPQDSDAEKIYIANFKKGAATESALSESETNAIPDASDLPF